MAARRKPKAYNTIPTTKDDFKRIATDLCYPQKCLEELDKAEGINRCISIMAKYRKGDI